MKSLSIKKEIQQKLNRNLILVYSGLSRNAHEIASSYVNKLSKSKKNKTKRAVSNEGKISISHFEVIDEYENCTKLKIQLITGRNHQIRSQMEYLGNPILNDVLYSAKKVESLNKDQICLMSKKLKFNHKSNKQDNV